ncbi:MAG: hypothetical protein V2A73_02250 [Pseudomonadota bacterium]
MTVPAPSCAVLPQLVFTTPRTLPSANSLQGRVVVLDVAFSAEGLGRSFEEMTGPFITGLGNRLAAWIDHHDHANHRLYRLDARFVLATKAEHGACPELITPELVASTGPVDTVVAHVDLDGLYAAAKWIRKGYEPYPGADADARCVDTRLGTPSSVGELVDRALRARFRDEHLKHRIVRWLVAGAGLGECQDAAIIKDAAREFDRISAETARLADRYQLRGRVAFVDTAGVRGRFDKTNLLLAGQKRAQVAMVRDCGMLTVAAPFDSGWDFLALFGLEGGMPTRVSIPESRLEEVVKSINDSPRPGVPAKTP